MIRDRCFVAILAAFSPFQVALAEEDGWSSAASGIIDFGVKNNRLETTRLVPDSALLGLESEALVQTSRINLEAWRGQLALNAQLRLVALASDQDQEAKTTVDDLYGEYSVTAETFLYLGRRNVVLGQSYGANPMDVFFDSLDLDRTANESRRRREVEGQDMLGFEILPSDNITLSGYWAPSFDSFNEGAPDRTLIAMNLLLPGWNADLTLLAFDDEHPGTGLSLTKTTGDTIVLYGDATLRRSRDRLQIYRSQDPSALPGSFITEEDSQQNYIESSIGFSYSFESSATLNVEYYYNQNGYSSAEWDEIAGVIDTNAANLNQGLQDDLPERNLLLLNSALRYSFLRQHYGFARYYHPDPLGVGASTEATVLHSLKDQSGVASVRVEYEVKSSVLLGVYASAHYGSGIDEFALRSNKLSSMIYATFYL